MGMIDALDSIPVGEIVAKHVDSAALNRRLLDLINRLATQLNEEASAQFINDTKAIELQVNGESSSVTGSLTVPEAYLLEYLADHDIPVAGGDGGTAHNVDGSVYHSRVNPNFWGTELPELALPVFDVKEEAENLAPILLRDEIENNAMPASTGEIGEQAAPIMSELVASCIQRSE